eukprot:2281801-Rhodomonas_salina.6
MRVDRTQSESWFPCTRCGVSNAGKHSNDAREPEGSIKTKHKEVTPGGELSDGADEGLRSGAGFC